MLVSARATVAVLEKVRVDFVAAELCLRVNFILRTNYAAIAILILIIVIVSFFVFFLIRSSKNDDQNTVVGALLKPRPVAPIPDASPFFLRQYIKGHYADIFELYPQLLTEIILRLPYQIQKHASVAATFEQVRTSALARRSRSIRDILLTGQSTFAGVVTHVMRVHDGAANAVR